MSAPTPENATKRRIRLMLKQLDLWYFMPVQTGYGAATLDFLGCRRDGRAFAIEAKAWGEDPTPRQWATMQHMAERGVLVFVCDDQGNGKAPKHTDLGSLKKALDKDN
jgi:hypothetical protein